MGPGLCSVLLWSDSGIYLLLQGDWRRGVSGTVHWPALRRRGTVPEACAGDESTVMHGSWVVLRAFVERFGNLLATPRRLATRRFGGSPLACAETQGDGPRSMRWG